MYPEASVCTEDDHGPNCSHRLSGATPIPPEEHYDSSESSFLSSNNPSDRGQGQDYSVSSHGQSSSDKNITPQGQQQPAESPRPTTKDLTHSNGVNSPAKASSKPDQEPHSERGFLCKDCRSFGGGSTPFHDDEGHLSTSALFVDEAGPAYEDFISDVANGFWVWDKEVGDWYHEDPKTKRRMWAPELD
jgi:hypothetical protein